MKASTPPPLRSTRLLDQLRERIRYRHHSLSTECTAVLTAAADPALAPFLARRLKAAQLRQSCCCCDTARTRFFSLSPQRVTLSRAQALGGAGLPGRRARKCQPLRYSQPPRRNRAKARFRRLPGVCSVPRATPRRQARSAQRLRSRHLHSTWGKKKHLVRGNVATAAAGAAAPPLSRRPRSGAKPGF